MSVNAREETFEHIELFGKPALFTSSHINRATVPEGFYCYDLRGSDYDPGKPIIVENSVVVNHAGTVLTADPIKFRAGTDDRRRISGKLNFLEECLDLAGFCAEHGLTLPPDNRKFILRPASPDEAGLFYSKEETDAEMGTVGHLRLDFGRGGNEFWSTWWPHNGDELNTPEFKAELDEFVNELRSIGPLQSRSAMSSCCYKLGGKISDEHHGFVAESEHYRYCLRCFPRQGEYDGYLYIYDKHQQELAMAQEPPEQGMTMGGI